MLAGSHRNAWPDETGTGGRTNRNTQKATIQQDPNSASIYSSSFKILIWVVNSLVFIRSCLSVFS